MQRLIGTELPLRPEDQCCYRTADKRDELATFQLIELTLLGHQLADGGDASRRTPPARALLASSRLALFCPARGARGGRWEGLIRKGVSRVSTQGPMENQNSSGYGSIFHEDVAHLDRSGPVARQKIPAKCAGFSIY